MIPVIFDPEAKSEFLDAVRYYEECQLGLGSRFKEAVESAIKSISTSPFRYRFLHKPFRRLLLFQFPYSIIFSIEPDHIHIIAVAHPKRKPGYWFRRS